MPADKKLKVHPLPKEMQGEAIADGPIPFIFGAKADKMKQRYWIRDITPKEEIGKHTWLEVFPKYQHDAVNFSSAMLVLNDPTSRSTACKSSIPAASSGPAYIFSDVIINDPLAIVKGDFAAPSTPWGWTKEVDPPPDASDQPEPQSRPLPAATARQPKTAAPATPAKR